MAKNLLLLIFALIFGIEANAKTQGITIIANNERLEKVLFEIQNQTDYNLILSRRGL